MSVTRKPPVAGLPDGHLRVVWNQAQPAVYYAKPPRYLFGVAILAALLVLVAAGLRRDRGTEVHR